MRKYQLVLSEDQRQFILTALIQCQLQGYFGADAEGREEIDLLVGMFNELSNEDPDVLQDFTS